MGETFIDFMCVGSGVSHNCPNRPCQRVLPTIMKSIMLSNHLMWKNRRTSAGNKKINFTRSAVVYTQRDVMALSRGQAFNIVYAL